MMTKNEIIKKVSLAFLVLKLIFGLVAIVLSFLIPERLYLAGYFIFFSLLADFLVSYLSRDVELFGPQQKIINIIIEIVPFGISPSIILFVLLKNSPLLKGLTNALSIEAVLLLIVPFTYVLFVAIRLLSGRFNNTKAKYSGIALQISAFLVASLPFIEIYNPLTLLLFPELEKSTYFFVVAIFFPKILTSGGSVIFHSVFLSMFVYFRLPLFSLKFENFNFIENQLKYYFLLISIALFAVFETIAIPLIFIVYLAFSFFNYRLSKILQHLSVKKELH